MKTRAICASEQHMLVVVGGGMPSNGQDRRWSWFVGLMDPKYIARSEEGEILAASVTYLHNGSTEFRENALQAANRAHRTECGSKIVTVNTWTEAEMRGDAG